MNLDVLTMLRLDRARRCFGYLADRRVKDNVEWTSTGYGWSFYLAAKHDPGRPVALVLPAIIASYGLCVTGLGDWTPDCGRPATTANWCIRLVEPSDVVLKRQFEAAMDVLIELQSTGILHHCHGGVEYISGSKDEMGRQSILLRAPMLESKAASRSAWQDVIDLKTLQRNWDIPSSLSAIWDRLKMSHRMRPMRVWGEDNTLVSPDSYADMLSGALVEAHLSLFLNTGSPPRSEGFFVPQVEQLVVWREGPCTAEVQRPLYLFAYNDDVPLSKGPYRQGRTENDNSKYKSFHGGWESTLVKQPSIGSTNERNFADGYSPDNACQSDDDDTVNETDSATEDILIAPNAPVKAPVNEQVPDPVSVEATLGGR